MYVHHPYVFHLQGMVMVSPEMDPTICWMFEAEIVLLFHAKTFHKGFQVTVHIGNVRQTATVEAVYGKVGSSAELKTLSLTQRKWKNGGFKAGDTLINKSMFVTGYVVY